MAAGHAQILRLFDVYDEQAGSLDRLPKSLYFVK